MSSRVKNRLYELIPYLFIIIAAVCMLWPQIHSRAFVSGLDYYFHMSRTYETAMQIKTGHFSYFLSLFSWDHNARIVNALYGPVGGYVSGLILLMAKSWYRWELCISFLALVLSGFTMYYLGHYWHVNRYVNLLISVLYMLSSPINDLVFRQTFTGFGAALLPLIALISSEILKEKDINPVKLALILVLIIEIHMMTFILSMSFLVPCILLGFCVADRNRKSLIEHVFKAAALTIVLSFNVWGSVLEVLGSNLHHVIPTFPGTNLGTQSFNTIMNTYPQTPLLQTPSVIGSGAAILILLLVILWILNINKINYVFHVFIGFGLFYVWLSSEWFPWRMFQRHFPSISALIQFPKRFLPMGLILLYLLLGVIISKDLRLKPNSKIIKGCALIFLILVTGWCWKNNYNYLVYKDSLYYKPSVIEWVSMRWRVRRNPNLLRNRLRNDQPKQFLRTVSKPVPDYLPTSSQNIKGARKYYRLDPYDRYAKAYYHHVPYRWAVVRHGQEAISVKSRSNRMVTVPFVKYAHTRVMLNQHPIDPKINQVGAMRLPLRKGQNQFSISYQPSGWFKIGMLISLLAWIGLFCGTMFMKLRLKKISK